MIALPANTRIWIAAGVTDMRRGFTGLSALVQTALEQDPLSGHVFVFRGRRGDLIKLLWFDGDGLCLFAKRLERGRFVWPKAESGTVSLTRAQLSMLLRRHRLAAAGSNGRFIDGDLTARMRFAQLFMRLWTHSQQSSWHTPLMVATRTTLPDLNTLDADALKALILAQQEQLLSQTSSYSRATTRSST